MGFSRMVVWRQPILLLFFGIVIQYVQGQREIKKHNDYDNSNTMSINSLVNGLPRIQDINVEELFEHMVDLVNFRLLEETLYDVVAADTLDT